MSGWARPYRAPSRGTRRGAIVTIHPLIVKVWWLGCWQQIELSALVGRISGLTVPRLPLADRPRTGADSRFGVSLPMGSIGVAKSRQPQPQGAQRAAVALGLTYPLAQRLRRAPELRRYRGNRRLELPRLRGPLTIVQRRCRDAGKTFPLRAGVPAPDGRVGPGRAHARGAGSGIAVLLLPKVDSFEGSAGGPQLGASGRSR